jgi:16S rRNA G966 N2-methylase RsmD
MNHSISSNNDKNIKLFPKINNNLNDNKELLSDDVGRYSISLPKDAEIITSLINYHINKINMSIDNLIITDSTAGVGGNSISFSKKFKSVNSIEIDDKRFSFLKNNINFYNISNVNLIKTDYLKIIENLIQDIVFIDPPWGGRSYKKKERLTLQLSDTPLEQICVRLKKTCKLVVLKLPLNYDLNTLFKPINATIYKYKIKKMYIIVIEY